jgi:hypothetical protein
VDGDDLEESEPSEPKTLAEIFRLAFPYYLAMGMTYDEYWRDDPTLVRDYRKAWEIRKKNDEFDRWRRGMYFYDALLRVSPVLRAFGKGEVKPKEYPDRPYPLTEKEAREQEQQKERENFFAFKKKLEAESKRNLEKMKEQEASKHGAD